MIAETLSEFAATQGLVFATDRSQTIGASEIGQCARKVFFQKNDGDRVHGEPTDDGYSDSWGARMRGTVFENNFWFPAMRARFGAKLLYAGNEQRTLISGFLSATPDGLLIEQPLDALAALGIPDIGGDGSIVLECKTLDPRAALAGEPKPEHAYQAIVQIGLFNELTTHRPQYAIVSYANASFWDDVQEFAVKFDAGIYANAKRRALAVMTATSAEELKPEGYIAGGRECEFCAYNQACNRMRRAVPEQATEAPDAQFIAEIADLARSAKQQRRDVEATKVKLREIENEIRERMRGKGYRRIAGNGVTVTWSSVKGRPSFDMPAIRAAAEQAGINISEFETTGESTDRLTITIAPSHSAAA